MSHDSTTMTLCKQIDEYNKNDQFFISPRYELSFLYNRSLVEASYTTTSPHKYLQIFQTCKEFIRPCSSASLKSREKTAVYGG